MRLPLSRLVLAAALGLATLGRAAADPPAPGRVASFNVCADQLVVALADPGQIAGLSPYATDPDLSVVADQARAFRRLEWHTESIIALAPDLVLIGSTDRAVTRRMLESLGFRVEMLPLVTTLAEARAQITRVAGLLGHPQRGARMVAELDAAAQRLAAAAHAAGVAAAPAVNGAAPLRTALVTERGGYTAGPGSLPAALLEAAGLRLPRGSPSGYGGFVALERLMVLSPDLLFLKDPPLSAGDQGALYLLHPALAARYPASRRIALPGRYTLCGGPAVVEALDFLTAAMTRLAAARP